MGYIISRNCLKHCVQKDCQLNLFTVEVKNLDILPQTADKGKALQFLQTQLAMGVEQTIACGDSGNDIALFGQNRGIIVGNAQPELLSWHRQNPMPQRYLASAQYAAGIIEGLKYFGLFFEA